MRPVPSVTALRSKADQIRGQRDAALKALATTQKEIHRLRNEEDMLLAVSELFRQLIDRAVTEGVRAVEALQTEGLKAVFDDQELSVKAEVEVLRDKVSVNLLTVQKTPDGEIEGLSVDAFGGSVLTVQSVLLRIIVMMRRGLRPFLCLDETLPAFDSNYISNMASFLSELCRRLDMDILMVTHNPALFDAADRSYRIVKKNGESWFERVR